MPCARQRVGKPLRDIDAVEALSLDRIMGSEATEKHLEDEQRQHHEQIFTERALRWRQRRSEEHTSELQSLMRISYAVFCLKKKKKTKPKRITKYTPYNQERIAINDKHRSTTTNNITYN